MKPVKENSAEDALRYPPGNDSFFVCRCFYMTSKAQQQKQKQTKGTIKFKSFCIVKGTINRKETKQQSTE